MAKKRLKNRGGPTGIGCRNPAPKRIDSSNEFTVGDKSYLRGEREEKGVGKLVLPWKKLRPKRVREKDCSAVGS